MGKKSKFSVREKEKIVLRFLKNEISTNYICEYFKVNRYALNKWVRRYCAHRCWKIGRCIDNGPMEGFRGNLKSQSYYLKRFETY